MKNRPLILIFAVLALTLATTPSRGQVISLNFYNGYNGRPVTADLIGPTESAGAFSAINWNNQLTTSGLSGTNLFDNSNNATTLDYTFNPNGDSDNAAGPAGTDGTTKLFGSGRNGSNNSGFPSTLTISQIPYITYNIYLYFNASFADRQDSFQLGGTTYYVQTDTVFNSYVQGTSTTAGVYTFSNYVEFTGLTGATQSIIGKSLSGNSTVYEGFQVVDASVVPEPSTYALIGLGMGFLFVLRRARKLA